MKTLLRPVVLPVDLIGKFAPCDLFNARGVLLVSTDSVIGFSVRNPFRPTRVFCQADKAGRISEFNPFAELGQISKNLAGIADRIVRNQNVSPSELTNLSRTLYDAWIQDADACLGCAYQCKSDRPSICHVVLVSLLTAELAAAHRLNSEQCASFIGGALTMNIAIVAAATYFDSNVTCASVNDLNAGICPMPLRRAFATRAASGLISSKDGPTSPTLPAWLMAWQIEQAGTA